MDNFKGRFVFYSNVNGKEQKIEKEFDNQNDYETFLKENNSFSLDSFFNRFNNFNFFSFPSQTFFEPFLNKKSHNLLSSNSVVDLDSYKKEAEKIEEEKRSKEQRKKDLEGAKSDLENYLKIFKQEWKTDLVKKIEEDLKKVNSEIKEL